MRRSVRLHRRSGAAAVEAAVVLPLLLLLLMGTWEVGRLVQVQAILSNAAREGARIAAQGQIINITGAYKQILVSDSDPSTPDVTSAVKNYLNGAGINTTGLVVTFAFLDGSGNAVSNPTQPYQGTKGQRFRVTATLPYNSFRWTQLNLVNVTNITVSVDWVSMIDDPFNLNTTLPTWNSL
jgi:Flp pilus assembly protein TadG